MKFDINDVVRVLVRHLNHTDHVVRYIQGSQPNLLTFTLKVEELPTKIPPFVLHWRRTRLEGWLRLCNAHYANEISFVNRPIHDGQHTHLLHEPITSSFPSTFLRFIYHAIAQVVDNPVIVVLISVII